MFDLDRWQKEAHQRLRPFLKQPRREPALAGTASLFTYLATRALEPFLQAYQDDPIEATLALGAITRDAGANFLVRNASQLRYQGALLLRRELALSPPLRGAVERVLLHLNLIDLIKDGLDDTHGEWFRQTLRQELETWTINGELKDLERALQSPPWQSRYAAIQGLRTRHGAYSESDLSLLQGALHDSSNHVRAAAARSLGHMRGPVPLSVRQALLETALHDRDLGARYAAARTLGTLRDQINADELIAHVVVALFDDDSFVRSAASLVLGQLGEMAARQEVMESLVAVLKDQDPYAREAAAQALGRLGPAAATHETMAALNEALLDTDYYVHEAAAAALTRLREYRALPDDFETSPLVA